MCSVQGASRHYGATTIFVRSGHSNDDNHDFVDEKDDHENCWIFQDNDSGKLAALVGDGAVDVVRVRSFVQPSFEFVIRTEIRTSAPPEDK